MLLRVLIIADTALRTQRAQRLLEGLDVSVATASLTGNFWDRASLDAADLIIISRSVIPAPIDQSLQALRRLPDEPDVVVVWSVENPLERAQLLISGCSAVLFEGLEDTTLANVLASLIERRRAASINRVHREIAETEQHLSDFDSSSPVMRNFMRMVRRVVEPDSSLLILGETGVGKERLARAIHIASPRGHGPFIPVNCAAFPETLLEGELFGYKEGAFTGASVDRRGYFELAHRGTIFLDEIGEVPMHLQVKLLRVLQERKFQALGSEYQREIDVRVMAATNRNLEQEITIRRFRRDLYYRLSVVSLEIPPLRDHPEDIPQLLSRYLEEFRQRMGRHVRTISDDALQALRRYKWPGNIRELINVVERAVILGDGETLKLCDLPPGIGGQNPRTPASEPPAGTDRTDDWNDQPWQNVREGILNAAEQKYLRMQLAATNGNLAQTSKKSGIKARTLYEMMRRHGLRKEDYRNPSSDHTR